MNDRPIPPDARESSDLEPLSEASRPPVPSGALSCEKADRKNANAPLRILLYIIIAALPLFTYDTAGQNTALTLLCPAIILIILLHVPILWMVDIPIARALGAGCEMREESRCPGSGRSLWLDRSVRCSSPCLVFLFIILFFLIGLLMRIILFSLSALRRPVS